MIAFFAGYIIDLLFRNQPLISQSDSHESDCHCYEDLHCCGTSHLEETNRWQRYFLSPLFHALRVFFFILIVSSLINLLISQIGEERLATVFFAHSIWQPLIATLVGLIPNCAASVAITQVFLKGGISFGSAIAGLCASAGVGLLVLMRESRSIKETLKVLVLLSATSFIAGIIIDLLLG